MWQTFIFLKNRDFMDIAFANAFFISDVSLPQNNNKFIFIVFFPLLVLKCFFSSWKCKCKHLWVFICTNVQRSTKKKWQELEHGWIHTIVLRMSYFHFLFVHVIQIRTREENTGSESILRLQKKNHWNRYFLKNLKAQLIYLMNHNLSKYLFKSME